jgi:hypothetical protein
MRSHQTAARLVRCLPLRSPSILLPTRRREKRMSLWALQVRLERLEPLLHLSPEENRRDWACNRPEPAWPGREIESVRYAGQPEPDALLTEACCEGLESCRSPRHSHSSDPRPIKGRVDRFHGKAGKPIPSRASGFNPESGRLRSLEKTCLLQKRIPLEPPRVIVNEIENRLRARANLDRSFDGSHPDLAYGVVAPCAGETRAAPNAHRPLQRAVGLVAPAPSRLARSPV